MFTYGQLCFLVGDAAFYLLNELRIRRLSHHDEALTERPEGLLEFPVEVVVRVNEQPIGADRGVVYFDRGLIGFVGSRMSFLLAAEDFLPSKGPSLTDLDLPFRPLKLLATGGKADVKISPLLGNGREYRRSLRRFFRENKPAHEPRQWPPLTDFAAQSALEEAPEDPAEIIVPEAKASLLDRAEWALERGDLREYGRLQDEIHAERQKTS